MLHTRKSFHISCLCGVPKTSSRLISTESLGFPKATLRFDDLLGLPGLRKAAMLGLTVYYSKWYRMESTKGRNAQDQVPGKPHVGSLSCPPWGSTRFSQLWQVTAYQRHCVANQGGSLRLVVQGSHWFWSCRHSWLPTWLTLTSRPSRGQANACGQRPDHKSDSRRDWSQVNKDTLIRQDLPRAWRSPPWSWQGPVLRTLGAFGVGTSVTF